jgi:hypothetical protein
VLWHSSDYPRLRAARHFLRAQWSIHTPSYHVGLSFETAQPIIMKDLYIEAFSVCSTDCISYSSRCVLPEQQTEQGGWSGTASDVYSGSYRLESRPRHKLTRLRFTWPSSVLYVKCRNVTIHKDTRASCHILGNPLVTSHPISTSYSIRYKGHRKIHPSINRFLHLSACQQRAAYNRRALKLYITKARTPAHNCSNRHSGNSTYIE